MKTRDTGEWLCACGALVNGIRLVCEACHRHKDDVDRIRAGVDLAHDGADRTITRVRVV